MRTRCPTAQALSLKLRRSKRISHPPRKRPQESTRNENAARTRRRFFMSGPKYRVGTLTIIGESDNIATFARQPSSSEQQIDHGSTATT
jgi:hypothetical protein